MAALTELRHVFVYGSLLAPEVLNAILQRVPKSIPALVRDFHRYRVKGRLYPAVGPAVGGEVWGKVLFDLTKNELQQLDDFEGQEYVNVVVEPNFLDDSANSIAGPLKANMYIWRNPKDENLFGDWDYETWRETNMAEFLKQHFSK